jgi:hypothetical protein
MRIRVPVLRLNRRQREVFVEKLPDTGNLALGGLVFGQFVTTGEFSGWLAALGVVAWGLSMGSAAALAKKEE